MSPAAAISASKTPVRVRLSRDDLVLRTALGIVIALLTVAVVFPLYALLSKSLEDMDGAFVGLENFRIYFDTPALFASITNSLGVAISAMLIVLGIVLFWKAGG